MKCAKYFLTLTHNHPPTTLLKMTCAQYIPFFLQNNSHTSHAEWMTSHPPFLFLAESTIGVAKQRRGKNERGVCAQWGCKLGEGIEWEREVLGFVWPFLCFSYAVMFVKCFPHGTHAHTLYWKHDQQGYECLMMGTCKRNLEALLWCCPQ